MGNIDVEKFKTLYETSDEYAEVRENEKMSHGIHILCVSGSHAYGTNRPDSDVDIRAVVGLSRLKALGVERDWETKKYSITDTVAYSYKQFFNLLLKGDPSIISLLGNDIDDYLYLSDLGRELVENHDGLITSKSVYNCFIGYSNSNLRRLELAQLGRLDEYGEVIDKKLVTEKKQSILANAVYNFDSKYPSVDKNKFHAEFDIRDDGVYINSLSVEDISMVDFFDTARDLKNITSSFGKAGKRNEKKTLFKLNKHCMHLIRGLLMGSELLETGKIRTYRTYDLPLLKSIMNGYFMCSDGTINSAFYDLLTEQREKADYAYKHTVLPSEVDKDKLADFSERFILSCLAEG
jgi:hypothetical protein